MTQTPTPYVLYIVRAACLPGRIRTCTQWRTSNLHAYACQSTSPHMYIQWAFQLHRGQKAQLFSSRFSALAERCPESSASRHYVSLCESMELLGHIRTSSYASMTSQETSSSPSGVSWHATMPYCCNTATPLSSPLPSFFPSFPSFPWHNHTHLDASLHRTSTMITNDLQ